MKTAWEEVRLEAEDICLRPEEAGRLSNLCILSALAFHLGLLEGESRKTWGTASLRNSLATLALSPLPEVTESANAWRSLAQSARKAASLIEASGGPDEWVSAFQSADFGRKTRGA
jgi:hypothetical protein